MSLSADWGIGLALGGKRAKGSNLGCFLFGFGGVQAERDSMSLAGYQYDGGRTVDRARIYDTLLDSFCSGQFVHDIKKCFF